LLVVCDGQSFAVNWEGHEGFFGEAIPINTFTDGVPPPKLHRKPDCQLLATEHAMNAYQQVPLPGINCLKSRLPPANAKPEDVKAPPRQK
jgi:hypothetical protein